MLYVAYKRCVLLLDDRVGQFFFFPFFTTTRTLPLNCLAGTHQTTGVCQQAHTYTMYASINKIKINFFFELQHFTESFVKDWLQGLLGRRITGGVCRLLTKLSLTCPMFLTLTNPAVRILDWETLPSQTSLEQICSHEHSCLPQNQLQRYMPHTGFGSELNGSCCNTPVQFWVLWF